MIVSLNNRLSLLVVLFLNISAAYGAEKNEAWKFPNNYPDLIEKAKIGRHLAREEIAKIIYKGISRYPDENDENDKVLFLWLKDIHKHDSFERKVARLFFTGGTSS